MSALSIAELSHVNEIWNNDDGTIGILFEIPHARSYLTGNFPDSFSGRFGYLWPSGVNLFRYVYIGELDLFEGLAHCYVMEEPFDV